MTSSVNHCPHWYRGATRQGTWRARNPSWLVLVAIDQTSLVTVRKGPGSASRSSGRAATSKVPPSGSPTSRSRSRPRDGAASCVPRRQESAASRRSPEAGPRSRPPGCPAMRRRPRSHAPGSTASCRAVAHAPGCRQAVCVASGCSRRSRESRGRTATAGPEEGEDRPDHSRPPLRLARRAPARLGPGLVAVQLRDEEVVLCKRPPPFCRPACTFRSHRPTDRVVVITRLG